jgi:hypothetical protein
MVPKYSSEYTEHKTQVFPKLNLVSKRVTPLGIREPFGALQNTSER